MPELLVTDGPAKGRTFKVAEETHMRAVVADGHKLIVNDTSGEAELYDLAIRYGSGNYPGLEVERLLSEEIFPVCSPRLTHGPRAVKRPQDLLRYPLLHDDDGTGWRRWLVTFIARCSWSRFVIRCNRR